MGSTNTYGYTYDAAGQRTQEASTVGTRDFAYDNQRQLTSAYRVDSSGQPLANYNYSFAYDPIGNWKSESANGATTAFTANALNQYTAIAAGVAKPQNPSYDLDGNMTSDGKGNSFVYDEENRLIEADTPANTSLAKVVSVYDGLSRRVEKRAYSTSGNLLSTTRYLYDGLLPIAECDANNVIQRTYTRGLDLSGTMQGAGGIGSLLALTDGTGSYSYFCDGNGNVVDLTNAYGTNVSHLEYDPFGNVVAQTGTLSQPYQWSSKENDGNGLTYYLYRFYNPSLGRWVNRDPVQEKGIISNLFEKTIELERNIRVLTEITKNSNNWHYYFSSEDRRNFIINNFTNNLTKESIAYSEKEFNDNIYLGNNSENNYDTYGFQTIPYPGPFPCNPGQISRCSLYCRLKGQFFKSCQTQVVAYLGYVTVLSSSCTCDIYRGPSCPPIESKRPPTP